MRDSIKLRSCRRPAGGKQGSTGALHQIGSNPSPPQIKKADTRMGICFSWQRMRDSNPRERSQSPVCYRYTNPLCAEHDYYTQVFGKVKNNFLFFQKISPSLLGREKKSSRGLDIALVAEAGRSGIGTGNQTQHTENGNHRGGSVADQRQGQTDNGHNADAHAGIDHNLEHQRGSGAVADQTAHIVGAPGTDPDAPADDGQLHDHDQHAAEEPKLLTDGGEDVVRMLGEEVTALGTVAVEQALTRQTAAGKRLEVDLGVVTFVDTLRVDGGVKQDQYSVSLVIAQELP